jgi:hypothetical protein
MEIICGSVVRIPFETSMYVHTSGHVSDEIWGQVHIGFVLSICIHVATREPLDRFLLNLMQRVEINMTTHEEQVASSDNAYDLYSGSTRF